MVDHDFIVPLLILGGPLTRPQENVGSDTEGKTGRAIIKQQVDSAFCVSLYLIDVTW